MSLFRLRGRAPAEELEDLRWAVLNSLPWQVKDLFERGLACQSEDALREWRYALWERLFGLAETHPPDELIAWSSRSDRAFCPVCRGGVQDGSGRGYAFPYGLKAHFRQCVLLQALDRWVLETVAQTIKG